MKRDSWRETRVGGKVPPVQGDVWTRGTGEGEVRWDGFRLITLKNLVDPAERGVINNGFRMTGNIIQLD